ncbi:hypothetical protein AYO21_02020 [Fonsecaea monophora]|uniref:N-acetyltransferase domain-containing protein n=1 Tax=Fonsecaea monophora TaxID=254056 RepID=A0A177FHM8_9EURO|nr:hypothetical protein AYO21_02020 [Fonsecaea monophora]OAG43793.1 hypothetical protein AYO21_02020 [Fonsecaea monophora]
MPLHVHQLSPSNPLDHQYIPAIARIHLVAWLTVPLMRAIYHGPPEAYPGYIASMVERHSQAFSNEGNCRFAVVVDDSLVEDGDENDDDEAVVGETERDGMTGKGQRTRKEGNGKIKGKVIAAIKYYINDNDTNTDTNTTESHTEDEPAPPPPSSTSSSTTTDRPWPASTHSALAASFWSQLVASRRQLTALLGPHILVDNLYTDPRHHRRGAGSMLMRHACAEADARGWPSMLEASPKGVGVYEAVGFERFNLSGAPDGAEIWVDLRRWEGGGDKGVEFSEQRLEQELERDGERGDGWYCQVLMVRPAGTKAGTGSQREVAEVGTGEAAVV